MEKIKLALSGHRKSVDNPEGEAVNTSPVSPTSRDKTRHATSGGLAGEGSHLAGATEERHPIYDQFATTGQHTKTSESAPHVSTTTNARSDFPGSGETGQSTTASALRPDSTLPHRPGAMEEMSTASIKSGVIGFGQGGSSSSHAAMTHIPERGLDGSNSNRPVASDSSHHGKDAALGAGALGAGTLGAHELTHRRDHDDLRRSAERDGEPNVLTDSDRSFPLAGGVTHRQTANEPLTTRPTIPVTTEQATASNTESNAGLGAGDLAAGALASQASSNRRHEDNTSTPRTQRSVNPISEQTHSHTGRDAALGAGALGAGALAGHELTNRRADKTHELTDRSLESNAPVTPPRSGVGDSRQTLASAAAAAAPTSILAGSGREEIVDHSHGGIGHKYVGDPCEHEDSDKPKALLFTDGPHATDTANRTDPHLHVPGEWDPTPADEMPEPTYGQETRHETTAPTLGGGADDMSRYYPSGTQRLPGQSQQSSSEHHYGRDAALAGAGAAAVGGLYSSQRERQPDSGPADATIGPHTSNVMNVIDPRVQPDPALQKHHQAEAALQEPASKTVGPHKSNVANIVDPRVQPEPEKMKDHTTSGPHQSDTFNRLDPKVGNQPKDNHYGRDAALASGAGAAGLGAYEAGKHHQREPIGTAGEELYPREASPYSSKKLDPRVYGTVPVEEQRFDPTAPKEPAVHDPSRQRKGPDAAFAGGAGIVGYESLKHRPGHEDHSEIQPTPIPAGQTLHQTPASQSLSETRNDPLQSEHHYGRDASLAGGAGAAGYEAYKHRPGQHETTPTQTGQTQVNEPFSQTQNVSRQPEHHYGRDAAVVGGTGAAGLGAYEAAKHYDQHPSTQPSASMNDQRYDPTARHTQDPTQTSQHHYGRDAGLVGGAGLAGAGAYAATRSDDQPIQHSRYDSVQQPNNGQPDDHQKRNAAALGATGVAAGAGAGYVYSQHEAEKAENERLAEQKAQEKAMQKELEHQQKQQKKELEHKQKEFEKEQAKEKQHHEKVIAAEEKHRQKEAEHQESIRQQQIEKERRLNEQLEQEREQKRLEDERRKSEDANGEGRKKNHLFGFLHRKKDKNSDEKSEEDSTRHPKEYVAAGVGAGAIGASAYEEHRHSSDSDNPNSPRWKGKNKLHKDPPPGHPAREALEGAGTRAGVSTAAGIGGKHEHIGVDGPIGKPDMISGDHETRAGVYGAHYPDAEKHLVTEPHTGLPMNVEKYGDGRGGTDANPTIGGHNDHLRMAEGQSGAGVTDWEKIKKANTPY